MSNDGEVMFTEKQIEIINEQIENSLKHYSYLFHLTVEDITHIYKNIDVIKLDFVAQKIKESVKESLKETLLDIKYDGEEDKEYNTKRGEVAKQIILSESPTTSEDTEPLSISEPNKRDADYPVSTYEYTKGLHGPQPALYNKYFSYNEHDDSDDKNKKQFFDNLTNELGFTEEELLYKNEKGNKQYEVRLDQILDKINDSGKYDKISILDESCNPLNGREHISDNATSGGKTKKRTKSSAILTKKRKKNEK